MNKQKKTMGQAAASRDSSTKGDHSILNKQFSFDVCLMNTNISIVQNDPMSWFINSRATRHVYGNKHLFKSLHKVVDGKFLYMGNNSSIKVLGKGQVELMFTLGNLFVLRDVYYITMLPKLVGTFSRVSY